MFSNREKTFSHAHSVDYRCSAQFYIFSDWLVSATLKNSLSTIMDSYSARWKMLSFACSHAFMFYKEAGYCAPTFSFLSIYISLFLSLLHRQAVSAEAGTMSTPTNPEVKELSPVDFIQLQQYIECEYRQAGGQAGRQLSQRLTPPPHTHTLPLPPTHTLIYTCSWFLISRGGSSLPHSVFFFFFK